MLHAVRDDAKKIASTMDRDLSDTELEEIFALHSGEFIEDKIKILHKHSETNDGISSAEVMIENDGQTFKGRFDNGGNGQVDAMVKAVNQALKFNGDIDKDSKFFPLESGSAASAGAIVIVRQNGYKVRAYAEGESLDSAGINGYVKAMNLIYRIKERSRLSSSEFDKQLM
jgi:hypothetical protein